jgi:hypothetical protein
VALLLGIIPLSALAVGTIGAYAAHNLSWIWALAGLALGVVALLFQMRTTEATELRYAQYRNPGMAEPV